MFQHRWVERGWLGGLGFFGALPDDAVNALTDAATEVEVYVGRPLVRVGDKAEHLFVVRSGRFSVRLRNGQEITQLGTRETIGELGLVDERPASADVIAMRGLGDPDVMLANDLVIRRRLRELDITNTEHLSPWRSYAACTLWATHHPDAASQGAAT